MFDRKILWDMMVNLGDNNTYKNLPTGTLHPAVTAIMSASDETRNQFSSYDHEDPLLVRCKSVCAIEGLHNGRDASANLFNAAMPAVS